MSFPQVIRIDVPAVFIYRALVIRVVAHACRRVGPPRGIPPRALRLDSSEPFGAEVVSAFGGTFNNVVVHSCGNNDGAPAAWLALVKTKFSVISSAIEVVLVDGGRSYTIDTVVPPAIDRLPNGGVGVHIARRCVDELEYILGPLNAWHPRRPFPGPAG